MGTEEGKSDEYRGKKQEKRKGWMKKEMKREEIEYCRRGAGGGERGKGGTEGIKKKGKNGKTEYLMEEEEWQMEAE